MRRAVVGGMLFLALSRSALAGPSPVEYERTTQALSRLLEQWRQLTASVVPYDVAFRRDPMRVLVDEQGQVTSAIGLQEGLAVQGVIWVPDHPLVVVDDALASIGEWVGPYQILEIHPDGIVVKHGERVLIIPLDRGLGSTSPSVDPSSSQ